MVSFTFNVSQDFIRKLKDHRFRSEGVGIDSLQSLLFKNPELITSLPDLELINAEVILSCREFSTSRGSIDLFLITSNADLVVIETKLLRNPESTRTVVAQVIDYIKALCNEDIFEVLNKIKARKNKLLLKVDIDKDDRLMSLIDQNLKTGNFKVIILGDWIHPNILGMVDSIQSAPHLAFTVYLVDLNPVVYDDDNIILTPRIVSNTVEIERSVVRIEIDTSSNKYKIESEVPSKTGKGTKPILTWDEYLNNIQNTEFRKIISDFKEKWIKEVDDSINMGQVGISAGLIYHGKRIPFQYIYDTNLNLFTEYLKNQYNVPDKIYNQYVDKIKETPRIYDKYVVGNKTRVDFKDIDSAELKHILDSALFAAKKIKKL